MGRSFFGSGFFPVASPPPAAYLALVAIFGSEASAAAWLEDWIAYAGDGATSEELLAALESVGVPADAIATLRARPVVLLTATGPELDRPFYDEDITVPAGAEFTSAIDLGTGY